MDDAADRINAAALLLEAGPPSQPALACGSENLSYAQLRRAVAQAAGAWQDCGVERGEVVVLRIARGIEHAVAFLGAIWAGAVPVPLGRDGDPHQGHAWDQQAPCRFILDHSREGYANAWRDSVLTLGEWRDCVAGSPLLEPVRVPPAAPACWTDPGSDGSGAELLRHGFAIGSLPPAENPGPLTASNMLAMLRALRCCGTAVLARSAGRADVPRGSARREVAWS